MKPFITVFTPTYNRAYIIENLYKSLKAQSIKDFEWLIVDDGSSDNTSEIVKNWIHNNNGFTIKYYEKDNGGKCSAINYGLDKAEGELFFTVDSDDILTSDAIEKVIKWEASIPKDGKFCGLVANRGYDIGLTKNTLFAEPYQDMTLLERYALSIEKPLDGERAWIFYTDIEKQYKYPIFEDENYMVPEITWNRMANDGYLVRVFNDVIWIFEYQEDGLTYSGKKRFLDRPKGHALWLRELSEFLGGSLIDRLKMYYTYYCDHKERLSKSDIAEYIGTSNWVINIIGIIKKIKDRVSNQKNDTKEV